MSAPSNTHVIQVALRDEGVLVLFADGSYSVYPPALLYGSRNLAMVMSGLEGRELSSLMGGEKV